MNNKTYQYINLDYLEMMADGDAEMKKVMIDMLFEELPLEIGKMRTACTANDWEELCAVSHKMKSTLSFVGNPAMTEANKDIERLSKDKENMTDILERMTILEETYPMTIQELRAEYERI